MSGPRSGAARSSGVLPAYHGAAGPQPARALSVSAIETYLTCPFKYFAQYVMRLDEEREDEQVMDPKRQGRFVHKVFETFFSTWQRQGHRGITAANLDAARAVFEDVVEERTESAARGRGGARAHEAAWLAGRVGPRRSGVPHGSRAAGGGGRAAARVRASRRVRVHRPARRPEDRAEGRGRPARSARRRHVQADRLQAVVGAQQVARAAAPDLRALRRTAAAESPRPELDAGRGGVHLVSWRPGR